MSKQLGIKEVLDLTFFDFVTGTALLTLDWIQSPYTAMYIEKLVNLEI